MFTKCNLLYNRTNQPNCQFCGLHGQIIGLTASPGIGRLRGGKPEQAVQHLYSLTASLDIEEICSVRRNVQDLEQHVARPKHGNTRLRVQLTISTLTYISPKEKCL